MGRQISNQSLLTASSELELALKRPELKSRETQVTLKLNGFFCIRGYF
jgi:hypothetical protein